MAQPSMDALTVTPKTGDDRFTHQGDDVDANLLGFWRWSCSDLMGNVMRGVLAEYIVGLALGCVGGGVRPEWDATDLCFQGFRVEVKSSASLQSWSQTKLSPIKFDIEPKTGWYAETNTYATERKRQADVFVFCVLTHTDKATVDPLNLDQWDFYVLSTNRLNAAVGEQKSITLSSLRRRDPAKASFADLRACIEAATQETSGDS
ncbi:MAG: hypothetical protein LC775_16945 [Acidobacteria bacterium]|nr:hypothetical protein [Acidobacteriota bacterium]